MKLTKKQIHRRLLTWIDNHPDCLQNQIGADHFWYVQNAIGDILEWPKWYSEMIQDILRQKSS